MNVRQAYEAGKYKGGLPEALKEDQNMFGHREWLWVKGSGDSYAAVFHYIRGDEYFKGWNFRGDWSESIGVHWKEYPSMIVRSATDQEIIAIAKCEANRRKFTVGCKYKVGNSTHIAKGKLGTHHRDRIALHYEGPCGLIFDSADCEWATLIDGPQARPAETRGGNPFIETDGYRTQHREMSPPTRPPEMSRSQYERKEYEREEYRRRRIQDEGRH